MTIQEQTFITYYASMTDAELLQIALNKASLIEVAQKTLANELFKRNLMTPSAVPPGPTVHVEPPAFYVFRKLVRMFERARQH